MVHKYTNTGDFRLITVWVYTDCVSLNRLLGFFALEGVWKITPFSFFLEQKLSNKAPILTWRARISQLCTDLIGVCEQIGASMQWDVLCFICS